MTRRARTVRVATLALAASIAVAGCGTDLPRQGAVDGSGPLDHALRSRHLDVDFVRVLNTDGDITTMSIRPGDDAVYLVMQTGLLYRFEPPSLDDADAGFEPTDDPGTLVLDISESTLVTVEEGLGGLAFDPTGNVAYVYHSRSGDGSSVLAEYAVEPDGTFVESSRRELFVIEQSSPNHNGGQLAFGPDSMLYIGVGDGSAYSDLDRKAIGLASPLGKILRIDPTPSGDLPYTIPPDNPAVGLSPADERIWARGLRNPSSFSFDTETGDLWIADVGQATWEEINSAPATNGRDAGRGLNFGWSAFEGPDRFNEDQPIDLHAEPYLYYAHPDQLCGAVQDGLVVREALVSELNDWYVYADWCQGTVFAHDLLDPTRESLVIGRIPHFTQMLRAGDGELYVSATGVGDGPSAGVFMVTSGR